MPMDTTGKYATYTGSPAAAPRELLEETAMILAYIIKLHGPFDIPTLAEIEDLLCDGKVAVSKVAREDKDGKLLGYTLLAANNDGKQPN